MKSIAIAAMFAALVGACGGSSTTTVTPPPAGTTIGPSGGTVTSSDGVAQLIFPAGALASSVNITTATMTDAPAVSGLVSATAYDFGPSGTQFAQPVTITLKYLNSQLPTGVSPAFLGLYLRSGTTWQAVAGSTVDTTARTVTGTTTHFSGFVVCSYPCQANAATVGAVFGLGSPVVLPAGGTVNAPGAVEQSNYGGGATLSLANLPAGITGSASVGALQSGTCTVDCFKAATLTLYAAASVAPGFYTVTVQATGDVGTGVTGQTSTVSVQVVSQPGYTLSLGSNALPLAQGASGNVTVTLARTNFTGTVALAAQGLPGGVSASFNPASLTQAGVSSTLTITASASASAGSYPVTIRGTAAGIPDQTQTLNLTLSSFAIAGTPATVSVLAGGTGTTGIKATRGGGFSGALTYAASGLPTGITATISSTSVADSMLLSVTAASGVSPGSYQFTVTATSGALSQQATITVVVVNSTTTRLDFSQCPLQPIWLAYQDGTGPWTHLAGVGGIYNVPVFASGTGGIAFVQQYGASYATSTIYASQAEFSANPVCRGAPSGISMTGTVANYGGGNAYVALGGAYTVVGSGAAFQLNNIAAGSQDLIAYLIRGATADATADRLVVRRGVAVTAGGSLTQIDFGAGSSVAPASASFTVVGADGPLIVGMSYSTGGCTGGGVMYSQNAGSTFIMTGVPAASQLPTDLHDLAVSDLNGASSRFLISRSLTLTGQTLTLGSPIVPIVTTVAGPYLRLQAAMSLPSEYQYVTFSFTAGGNNVSLSQTGAYRGGGSAVTLAAPDLSGAAGFQPAWEASTGTPAQYTVEGNSAPPPYAPVCTAGTSRSATVTGTH